MKYLIKCLSLAAIAGFAFLNVFSKKNEKVGRVQAFQTMPQIPNGDFEDWKWYKLKIWQTTSCPECGAHHRYTIFQDSITVYHGKYSANIINGALAENKFAISVHPSSLHGFVISKIQPSVNLSIIVDILKNGIVVDSGKWVATNTITQWTEVNIPITNTSQSIDSALITIKGGVNSWVDDLFFE